MKLPAKGGHFGSERYGIGGATTVALLPLAETPSGDAEIPNELSGSASCFQNPGPPPAEILRNEAYGYVDRASWLFLLRMTRMTRCSYLFFRFSLSVTSARPQGVCCDAVAALDAIEELGACVRRT